MIAASVALDPRLTREYLLHHGVCPDRIDDDGQLVVAAAPDALRDSAADLELVYGRQIQFRETPRDQVERLVERLATNAERVIELARADYTDDALATDVRDLANQPPVIRYVNLLVRDAYDSGASDIHLEAARSGLAARFRVDGVLVPAPEPPAHLHHAVVSRLKLLAELDIAERRRPQDGRIRVRLESRELDLRVSCIPTLFGESVVLRLLDRGGRPIGLRDLGMSAEVLAEMSALSGRAHGMVLVTGPTGSGKTTTLYAALQTRNSAQEKLITVEDPVEYQLAGITQMPVQPTAGVTFATALRAILRQDPDVVMIGEMRDEETAEIAVQAAMTGHLVFSTLHTNDAISTIARLADLRVPDYLLAATLQGVLAQRLVRRVCTECLGAGCAGCHDSGLRGRIGLFELLTVTDEFRDAVVGRAPRSELRRIAVSSGMITLRTDGMRKVADGETTQAEIDRVVQD